MTQTETDTIPTWRLQDRLIRSLDQACVSVQEMADELGVTRTTVGNYLHGRRSPRRSTLRLWAMRTGVPFAWLAYGEEHAEPVTDPVTIREPVRRPALKHAA